MANEILITGALSATKDGVTVSSSTAKAADMGDYANSLHHTVQDVGHSVAEDVEIADIDVAREYVVKLTNLDGTNYVDVIPADGGSTYIFRIRPGESFGPVRVIGALGNVLRVKANSAACRVEVVAVEADPSVAE